MSHAKVALARASTDDLLSIASASALSGLASWAQGDLDSAYAGYAIAADHLGRADHLADVMGCTITLAGHRHDPGTAAGRRSRRASGPGGR